MTESTTSTELVNFIDEDLIHKTLEESASPAPERVQEVLKKASERNGLDMQEVAILLQNSDTELDELIFSTAKEVKQGIYGNRLVLFAPLYITNECGNQCEYCGFNAKNQELKRKTLTMEEISNEVRVLEDIGQKRLLMVYGEHPKLKAEWIAETMTQVYKTISEKSGEIRRVNVNCAPLSVDGFRKLAEAEIGTYQCFQESYHQETYKKMHVAGKKTDFLWRLYALHRAQEAGIDDVAMGALFGLYNHKFEVLGLMMHAAQLEKDWGVGPHTISFPRIEPAMGSEVAFNPPHAITDHEFKKIVAILRLAVPYTGLILTTRESAEMRSELVNLGVSQISAGSRTYPGAYSDPEFDRPDTQQFCIGDNRSLDDVLLDIIKQGYLPSWCTACYRLGRTGDHFMELAKKGQIQNFCHPNALLTFNEYLHDYASDATREAGQELIARELELIPDEKRREMTRKRLARIDAGERDLYI
ncbi:MAG: [FeFe] hydrogenase H-cluster radical SAM maturase HydG [Desulfovibrio sp.]